MAKRKELTLWDRAAKHGWNYNGDMSLEYGGTFWKWDGGPDYVNAVRVTPCSDAGGPDNLFEVETGSIYLGEFDQRNSALNCTGVDPKRIGPYTLDEVVYACLSYQGIERDVYGETIVRIGKHVQGVAAGGWAPAANVILPGNARLDHYIFREHLN